MIVFEIIGMIVAGLFGLLIIYAITGAYIQHCAETEWLSMEIGRLKNQIEESQKLYASLIIPKNIIPKKETK